MQNQREEMNGDVSEINVQHLCVSVIQDTLELHDFASRNWPGRLSQSAKPKSPQEMKRWFANDKDGLERETVWILAFLCNDNGLKALKRGNLAVDMQHFRLKKCRAIAGNNGPIEFGHAPPCNAKASASTGQNRSLVSERLQN
jgi:hypothetical protein